MIESMCCAVECVKSLHCDVSVYYNQIALQHDSVALCSIMVAFLATMLECFSVVFEAVAVQKPLLAECAIASILALM